MERNCKDVSNKYIDQWGLEEEFLKYIDKECTFCSTLVDRIVPGRVRDERERARLEKENGYQDQLIDVGEVFGVWNIEGPAWLEERLPFKKAGLNCPVVPDVAPYKKRKVRILNGAHTGVALGAFLAGYDIVRTCMHDDIIRGFMNKMLQEEVVPTLPFGKKDLEEFTAAVQERFDNPFVNHELLSISLNSTSKWQARNLPSFLEYWKLTGKLPRCLTMSFAAYLAFYAQDIRSIDDKGLHCCRPQGDCYICMDDRWILEFYYMHRKASSCELVRAVMACEKMWGQDLTKVPGFEKAVVADLELIYAEGVLSAFASCL